MAWKPLNEAGNVDRATWAITWRVLSSIRATHGIATGSQTADWKDEVKNEEDAFAVSFFSYKLHGGCVTGGNLHRKRLCDSI